VEPIEDKLRDMGACWAAKAIRTRDPPIHHILQQRPTGFPPWRDGTGGPQPNHETPLTAAFHLTAVAHPEEISWGNCTDHRSGNLCQITLLRPEDPKSKEKGYWAAMLAQLIKDQWTLTYSDDTGRDLQVAAGSYVEGKRKGAFLGNLASVADGERTGITLALAHAPTDRKVCILTDSMTALHTSLQLSRGDPPRSRIESELRDRLIDRSQPTAVAWIRGHIGIEGNTIADHLAELHSHLGEISLHARTATHEGLQQVSRANRKQARTQPGFGVRRPDWHRLALSAFTWYRTEKGPQKAWPHRIGKAEDPSCPCGHPVQTGEHIVFHCPLHTNERNRLLRGKKTLLDIDHPDWRKEGDDTPYDAIDTFFDYLYFES